MTKVPLVCPVSTTARVVQVCFWAMVFGAAFYMFKYKVYTWPLVFLFFAMLLTFLPSLLINKSFNKGVSLIKKGKLEESLPFFHEAVAFYTRHPMLDKYRIFLFLDASPFTLRETSLNNIAHIYVMTGRREEGIALYKEILKNNPEHYFSEHALQFLKSVEEKREVKNPE